MMHRFMFKPGTQKQIVNVFVGDRVLAADAESAEGVPLAVGKTGLNQASINKLGYIREGASADVNVSPAAGTLGTWKTGGFIEIDATNLPGWYQLSIENAALANGVKFVDYCVQFAVATDAQDVQIHIDLIRSLAF